VDLRSTTTQTKIPAQRSESRSDQADKPGPRTCISAGTTYALHPGQCIEHSQCAQVLPRLVITSDTTDFDHITVQHFLDEGFQVAYLPYTGDKKDYNNKLHHLADPLDLGDKYAIVGM
jgi:hypothetical protein